MKRKVLFIITLIVVILLSSCAPYSIDKVETREIEATIEDVYILHGPHTYATILEYGGSITVIDSDLLYNYCESRVGQTIPATIEITYYYNNNVSYRILPDITVLK